MMTPPSDLTPSQQLLHGRRDQLGFLEGEQPSLSYPQIVWMTYRMGTDNVAEANELAKVDPDDVARWHEDEGFLALLDVALHNKRESFRLLGAQLLPNALRTIARLYEKAEKEGNMRAAQLALNMHLRSQGLMVDKVSSDDSSRVDVLLELLREQRPITVIDMAPRP